MTARLVQLGTIGAPHGVRGEVRLKSFTDDPLAIGQYRPLRLADGRTLTIAALRPQGDMLVVRFDGVDSREQAAALTNLALFVERDRLPRPDDEDEFYHEDLIGLDVVDEAGMEVGRVVAVHDFGAGTILEVKPASGASLLVPFTRAAVPAVDLSGRRLAVDRRAAGLLPDDEDDA